MTTDIYNFGDSPYLSGTNNTDNNEQDDTTIKGGEVGFTKNKLLQFFFVSVLVIVIIYLLLNIFYKIQLRGEDYNQRNAHRHFNNLHGEAYDEDAKQAIAYGEAIDNPRAIDHYRLGTTYLVNANNPRRAHYHFKRALNEVIQGNVDAREAPFIIDRIDDYKDRFVDFPDIEELPIQQAIIAHYENQTNLIKNIEKQKPEIREDDPEFTQKILLSRQDWQSDSQNVHDSAVYEELKQQLTQVREENAHLPNISLKDYNDVANWLKIRYKDEPENYTKISKVLDFLNRDYPIGAIPGFQERDVLVNAWRRAYDPANKENFNEIREAIGGAVLDCVEGDTVVCMSGRTSKIWQGLATLDKDPEIGVLKSKQMLRNEIYERSAKIVADHVGPNGSASDALKDAYVKGENTEQVKELTECMKKQIEDLKTDYDKLLPKDQLELAITECASVV
jgi:hypothetical protein